METAHLRKLAERSGARFVAIRAISDRADEPIAPELLSLVDPRGKPRITAALAFFARRPSLIPAVMRLKRNSDQALRALGSYLSQWLDTF
jgi:hypothetical protein